MLTLSIVIVNHNYERFLKECIDNALAQTYPDCEVIVVDDGSTDGSRELIRSYGDKVQVILKENGGQGSGINVGWEKCKGDVALFLDADDVLLKEAGREIMEKWDDRYAKVHFRLQIRDVEGKNLGSYPHSDYELARGDVAETLLLQGYYVGPPASGNAYNRRVLEKILPMPGKLFPRAADVYLNTRAPFYGPVLAIDKHLGIYRMHGSNSAFGLSFGDKIEKLRRRLDQLRNCRAVLLQEATRLGREDCAKNWHPDSTEQRINMACFRLDPTRVRQEGESAWKLARELIRSTWSNPRTSWKERFSHLMFALVLAASPTWFLRKLHAATPRIKRYTKILSINKPVS